MSSDNVFAPSGTPAGEPAVEHVEAFQWEDDYVQDILGLFRRALNLITANLGTIGIGMLVMVGLSFVSGGVNIALSLPSQFTDSPKERMLYMAIQYGVSFAFFFVSMFFQIGLFKMLIVADRGGEVELDMLWSQTKAYPGAIAAVFLVAIASALGLILLIVPGIIVGLGLIFSVLICVDEVPGPVEALTKSWELTDGHKVFLFVQSLAIFVLILGIYAVTCCTGAPIAMCIAWALQAVTYNAFVSRQNGV